MRTVVVAVPAWLASSSMVIWPSSFMRSSYSCGPMTVRVYTLTVIGLICCEDRHAGTTSAPASSDPHDLPLRPRPGRHLGAAGACPQAAGPAGPGPGHLRRTLGLRRDRPGPDPAPAPGVLAGLGRARLRAHRLPDLRAAPGPG